MDAWSYKDSHRYEWTFTCWDTGDRRPVDGSQEDVDWVWGYEIFREGNPLSVMAGQVTGQLDRPPKLKHLLLDWQNYINEVAAGAVEYVALLDRNFELKRILE